MWYINRQQIFLFSDPLFHDFSKFLFKNPNDFWRTMYLLDEWKDFSLLALHFITLPTSEADVERVLSVQREIMGTKMTNLGTLTLESRLRLNKRGIK